MSDEFKRKLEAYEKGELSASELEEFEQDLEKLEQYQQFLEDTKTNDTQGSMINEKKQHKILRRGKWKARLQTALFAIMIIVVVTIVSSILTAVYYAWGTPDRVDVFGDVIDHTLTVTDPYGYLGGKIINSKPFFGLEVRRDLSKRIGDETIQVGELEVNFLFSMMAYPEREHFGKVEQNRPAFSYPGAMRGMSDWNKLEQLPDGTVVSAYVSFAELMDTEEVFQLFEGKNMELIWLAVDTGLEATDDWYEGIIFEPIGFPSSPIWHDEDMILESREEEQGPFGGTIVSEGYSSPEYTKDDSEILHQQFMKTLSFLQDHERKADKLYPGKLELTERMDFLENKGIQHYGVVITGPSKEVLKLQEEAWVEELEVDEVSFWNWR